MTKKILRLFLAVALVFGSLLFISIGDILAAPPEVSGVVDGEYYNVPVTITFDDVEGTVTATLNENAYLSGTEITEDDFYILIVTDGIDDTIISFWIDKEPPIITIDEYILTPTNQDITVTATVTGGTLDFTSHTFTENGSFTFTATDLAGNTSQETVVITNIERNAPVVTGVINNAFYNVNLVITFDKGSGMLNNELFNSGETVSDEGSYVLVVTDDAGNNTTVNFVIDKTPPVVGGVANNTYYNTNRTITFNEGTALLNGVAISTGTVVSVENTYVLEVTDLAGNKTSVNFVLDKTPPVVGGVVNNTYYNTNRTITFNEGSATLNGAAFTTGTVVSVENTYVLEVTDLAGNKTTVNFVVDKTPPVITIAPYESILAVSSVTVNASVNEGSLNSTSRLFTANGSYKFIATDLAGNVSERTVTISNIGYTINYSLVGTGGDLIAMVNSIVVNSGGLVIEGRSIMFTATPATRYRVYAWRLDGNVVGDRSNTYLLNMLNRGMNVTVEFVLEGDINNSGSVSITDLVILRRYLAGLETINDKARVAADVNNSGGVSITDLVILRRRLAGLE